MLYCLFVKLLDGKGVVAKRQAATADIICIVIFMIVFFAGM